MNSPINTFPHTPQWPLLEQEGREELWQNFPRVNCRPVISSLEVAASSEGGPESDPHRRLREGLSSVGSSPASQSQCSQTNPGIAAGGLGPQIRLSHFWSGSTLLLHESHSGPLRTPRKDRLLIFHRCEEGFQGGRRGTGDGSPGSTGVYWSPELSCRFNQQGPHDGSLHTSALTHPTPDTSTRSFPASH